MVVRPNRLLIATVMGVAGVVVAAGGCSGGSGQRTLPTVVTRPAPTTTSSLPTSTSTTVVVVTTTVVVPPTTSATTPEDQAKAFFEAWKKGDRAAAEALGEPVAVAAVFARPWSAADGWSFSQCEGAAGSEVCTWGGSSSNQLLLLVRSAAGGLSVSVTDARFG